MANLLGDYAEPINQYEPPFLTVASSLKNATVEGCLSNSCSSSSCSCNHDSTIDNDYLTLGEKHYNLYVYYLNKMEQNTLNSENHQHCLFSMYDLVNTILSAINEGKLFIASELTLRLADIYFSAFVYFSKAIGTNEASSLLDSAQVLLEEAHDLVTKLEKPDPKTRLIN